jgi:hypothetical protein
LAFHPLGSVLSNSSTIGSDLLFLDDESADAIKEEEDDDAFFVLRFPKIFMIQRVEQLTTRRKNGKDNRNVFVLERVLLLSFFLSFFLE